MKNSSIRIELGTEKLREAVNKVYKGVGNNSIFMTTLIIGIEGKEGNLVLTGTDRVSTIKVTLQKVLPAETEFYTNTTAELFKKLLDKTQSATVILEIEKNRIVFSGSGDASLEIINNDEDGENVCARIPETVVEGKTVSVKKSDLTKFNMYLKGTYPESIENPVYIGYRVGKNKAMTYNNFGANMVEIDWDTNILIPENVVKLFPTLTDDKVEITISDENKIKVKDSTVEITGSLRPQSHVDAYDLGKFEKLVYSDLFNKSVLINRDRLMRAIDRISLFMESNDNNVVGMEVDGKSVVFITFAQNCVEKVDFTESENENILTTRIGIDTFSKALASISGENVRIAFGEKAALRISDEEDRAYLLVPYARER